jgi:hypothetical protein
MKFWHDRLPNGNTLPRSIEEAKKIVCYLDLPHIQYPTYINDYTFYHDEYTERTTCLVCGQGWCKRGNKKFLKKWYSTFLSLPIYNSIW